MWSHRFGGDDSAGAGRDQEQAQENDETVSGDTASCAVGGEAAGGGVASCADGDSSDTTSNAAGEGGPREQAASCTGQAARPVARKAPMSAPRPGSRRAALEQQVREGVATIGYPPCVAPDLTPRSLLVHTRHAVPAGDRPVRRTSPQE